MRIKTMYDPFYEKQTVTKYIESLVKSTYISCNSGNS